MIYYLTTLKDTIGNNYLGIRIDNPLVEPFLKELKEILDQDYSKYVSLQQQRDHGSYHITVINVMDYNKLSREMGIDKFVNSIEPILKYPIDDLQMLGIGTAMRTTNRAYFVVCRSEKLKSIRDRFNLENQDFHITIGFFSKDVFGVPKNQVITKENRFLKLLKVEYYKKENWNFLRNIENFDLNKESEIIPVKLHDNLLKVKCDGHFLDVSILDDEKFWIMAKYPINEDLPRLSETEIAKILNKK